MRWPRAMRNGRAGIGGAAAALVVLATAAAPEPPSSKPGRVWHIQVGGDLDCAAMAAEAGAAIERANRRGAGLIILEMDGDRGRLDLARDLARAVRDSEAPVCAYLADPRDHRVGLAPLLIGLSADSCAIAPGVRIVHDPGDDLPGLAPDRTDWEQVLRQLAGDLHAAAQERGDDPGLPVALVHVHTPLWLVAGPEGAALIASSAGDEASIPDGVPVLTVAPGGSRLRLAAEDAVAVGLIDAAHASVGRLLAASGRTGARRAEQRITSGLADAAEQVVRRLRDIDERTARIDARLDVRPADGRTITARDHVEAGRRASEAIMAARAALERAEEIVAEYPELLRGPAPGATEVAATSRSNETAWRRAFQSRRDRLAALERRAVERLARGDP